MHFALFTALFNTTWADVLQLWEHLEATGWDAAGVTDHFMPATPDRLGDAPEAWTTLAALAARVPRMRIGTIVTGNTYRHPTLVAKMAAGVDVVSGGRLFCGIGAAYQQNEHDAYGLPYPSMAERLGRLDEACQVLKLLWTQPKSTFAGRYYQLSDAPLMPKPVQRPHPELLIGGAGEKVTLRIAARHADHWNVWGGPETLAAKSKVLEAHCADVGRDPAAIKRSVNVALAFADDPAVSAHAHAALARRGFTPEHIADTLLSGTPADMRDKLARLRDAGCDTVFIPTLSMKGDLRPLLSRFMDEVASRARLD
jgi:F420-dependent oxidoreductase-like protein